MKTDNQIKIELECVYEDFWMHKQHSIDSVDLIFFSENIEILPKQIPNVGRNLFSMQSARKSTNGDRFPFINKRK